MDLRTGYVEFGKPENASVVLRAGRQELAFGEQRNIHHVRAGVELKVSPGLSVSSSYHSWWLASPRDGLYNAAGAMVARMAAGTAGRHVGHEADAQLTWTLPHQMLLGGGYSNIFPGTFLKNTTPGRQYRVPYVMFTYSF